MNCANVIESSPSGRSTSVKAAPFTGFHTKPMHIELNGSTGTSGSGASARARATHAASAAPPSRSARRGTESSAVGAERPAALAGKVKATSAISFLLCST